MPNFAGYGYGKYGTNTYNQAYFINWAGYEFGMYGYALYGNTLEGGEFNFSGYGFGIFGPGTYGHSSPVYGYAKYGLDRFGELNTLSRYGHAQYGDTSSIYTYTRYGQLTDNQGPMYSAALTINSTNYFKYAALESISSDNIVLYSDCKVEGVNVIKYTAARSISRDGMIKYKAPPQAFLDFIRTGVYSG